jgi:hypothetical protein
MVVPRQSVWTGEDVITPRPVALVEHVNSPDIRGGLPRTTDALCAREANVLHQVNKAVAQSKIRRCLVDRFYASHFDLWHGRCRRLR